MECLFRRPKAIGNAEGLIQRCRLQAKSELRSCPCYFHSKTLHSQVSALIDSGATESFISPDLVKHFSIPTHEIPKPKVVRNIDGTKNSIGNVTHAATLRIHYEGQDTEHLFYVIDLGDDHMLLGMPFLKAANPHINWTHSVTS